MICPFCNEPVDPASPTTLTRVRGWERRALSTSRRSGSDIVMRERLPEHAHNHCVEKARSGLSAAQESLAL